MANVNYREVKRKASVGERIKIVAAEDAEPYYKNGDVLTVSNADRWTIAPGQAVSVMEFDYAIKHSEYVVLEPVEDALYANFRQFVLDNADAIRAILPALETQLSVEPPVRKAQPKAEIPRKPLTRAEVIAKATADTAELLRIGHDAFSDLPEASPLYGKFYSVEFHVNREKRAVTALVKRGRTVYAKATAKAAPGDVFHAEIGKAIALRRALGLTVPNEYVNAPKPDKAEVGAVVSDDFGHGVVTSYDGHRGIEVNGGPRNGGFWTFTNGELGATVLDDTDVDYSVNAGNAESTQSSAA